MPPRRFSRFTFSEGTALLALDDERTFLTEREPFSFVELADNRTHVLRRGDTLQSLAGRYFRGLFRPSGLWWVIADFQPQPIHDPTVLPAVGTVLFIPSTRTVEERIFAEARRRESNP